MRVLVLLSAGLVLAACHSQAEEGLPTLDASRVRVLSEPQGPWTPHALHEEVGGPWRVANGGFDDPGPEVGAAGVDPFVAPPPAVPSRLVAPSPPVQAAAAPPAPTLSVPRRRTGREARPVGKATQRSAVQLACEHFMDYPTHVKAARITLYLPPAYAGLARLKGQHVDRTNPQRHFARGQARLVLRELTLEADRLVLRIREDGLEDFQLTARGGVELVSEVRGNVLREQGLKGLLITNEQVVPIR